MFRLEVFPGPLWYFKIPFVAKFVRAYPFGGPLNPWDCQVSKKAPLVLSLILPILSARQFTGGACGFGEPVASDGLMFPYGMASTFSGPEPDDLSAPVCLRLRAASERGVDKARVRVLPQRGLAYLQSVTSLFHIVETFEANAWSFGNHSDGTLVKSIVGVCPTLSCK